MPNRKPQVMWMAKAPATTKMAPGGFDASSAGWCKLNAQERAAQGTPYSWKQLYRQGWRIVKVEVRETKKEK